MLALLKTERVSVKKDLINASEYFSSKDIHSANSANSFYREGHSKCSLQGETHSNKSLKLKLSRTKQQEASLKIIICRKYHNDIKKFRALVNN